MLPDDIEQMLERAACRGARRALKEVGLADDEAAHDIRNLRDFVSTIKSMQRTFLVTVVRWLTIGTLALIAAGIYAKGGFFDSK